MNLVNRAVNFGCSLGGSTKIFSRMAMTLFDNIVPPGTLNLCMGAPGPQQLSRCAVLIQNAANARMVQDNAATLFNFGPELGAIDFRKALVEFLSRQYQQHPVQLDSVMETAGSTHGLHLLSSVLFAPGDVVFMEHSTYFLALQILRDGMRMSPKSVRIDSEGIDVDALERSIEELGDVRSQWKPTPTRPYWALVYLVPNFQNPTGFCISPDRAKRLVEVARKYDLLVVCDDVYDLLYFPKSYPDGHPPLRLFGYDDSIKGHIVSNGSFSKIFGVGTRVGWLEAPKTVIDLVLRSGIPKSGGAFNHMSAGLLTHIMQSGEIDKLMDQTKATNEERCKAMTDIFRTKAPQLKFNEPTGGYFLWLKLPEDFPYTAKEFSDICMKEYKIIFLPGEMCSPAPTDVDKKHIRVCYVWYSKEELADAASKISDKFIELYSKK